MHLQTNALWHFDYMKQLLLPHLLEVKACDHIKGRLSGCLGWMWSIYMPAAVPGVPDCPLGRTRGTHPHTMAHLPISVSEGAAFLFVLLSLTI